MTDTTVKHVVMWTVRGETAEEKAAAARHVKEAFESLRGRIPGLLRLEVGIDFSRVSHACDVLLFTEFTDEEALRAYAEHPEHTRVRQSLGDLRVGRYQVDYV